MDRVLAALVSVGLLVTTSPSVAAPLDDLFRRLSYKDFPENSSTGDVDRLLAKAGVRGGDLITGRVQAPDLHWIIGWRRNQPIWDYWGMIGQAAINRTWETQCYIDFDDYNSRWMALEKQFRPTLAKLVQPGNYYDRASGLFKLLVDVDAAAEAAHIVLPNSHPTRGAGFRYEIVKAIIDLHRQTNHGAFIRQWYQHVFRGRPLSTDRNLERNIFCNFGDQRGTHRTPPMTILKSEQASGEETIANEVRWPAWRYDPNPAAINSFLASAKSQAETELALETPDVPPFAPSATEVETKGKVVREYGQVGLVRSEGSGLWIELTFDVQSRIIGDCRATNQIDRIRDDGSVVYREHCKNVSSINHERHVSFSIPEPPPSVSVRKGDFVTVMGWTAGDRTSKTDKRGSTRRDHKLERCYLLSVARGGDDIFSVEQPIHPRAQEKVQPKID